MIGVVTLGGRRWDGGRVDSMLGRCLNGQVGCLRSMRHAG